jgi:hypothetical protein
MISIAMENSSNPLFAIYAKKIHPSAAKAESGIGHTKRRTMEQVYFIY